MIDLNLLKNIMEEVRENTDLLDSLSPNQFKSKISLINDIKISSSPLSSKFHKAGFLIQRRKI